MANEFEWVGRQKLDSYSYTCGYCNSSLVSNEGYLGYNTFNNHHSHRLYICHNCSRPTFFDFRNIQTPKPLFGGDVTGIPDNGIENLYQEARKCFSASAYTASVMCCRKLLMNIAVVEGAKENMSFVFYVNYLSDNNYIPPKGRTWVDEIRKMGNDATHKVDFKKPEEAKLILTFSEMLLKFIYEMPHLLDGK